MNITEAVNAIIERYPERGYDAFIDLSKIKDDDLQEAVRFIKSMRRRCRKEPKRIKKLNRETLKDMIESGYTYKGIAKRTGLTEAIVVEKVLDYGFKKLYYQMRPRGIRAGVSMICINIETGERRVLESIRKAENAFDFKEGYLREKTKDGRFYANGGWVFRRVN
nr:MAG TPA: HIN RECOMBINASE/DNA Complex-MEDIATED RECOGNITION, PROTEIN-DNA COMPLEX, HIN.24A [Caudoviricetes sp.]